MSADMVGFRSGVYASNQGASVQVSAETPEATGGKFLNEQG
jgi:hypothetical protein